MIYFFFTRTRNNCTTLHVHCQATFFSYSIQVPMSCFTLLHSSLFLCPPLSHTHVFWEDLQLPRWEWLMTPFTAQTPHNQRCWGSVSARCPVWVITPGTQLIYYPTINPAVHTCCPLQCPSVLVHRQVCYITFFFFFLSVLSNYAEQADSHLKWWEKKPKTKCRPQSHVIFAAEHTHIMTLKTHQTKKKLHCGSKPNIQINHCVVLS